MNSLKWNRVREEVRQRALKALSLRLYPPTRKEVQEEIDILKQEICVLQKRIEALEEWRLEMPYGEL